MNAIPHDALALAWGLPTLPRLRFVDAPGTKAKNVRLPGKGNSNSHGARPVHLIIKMIKWIWTSSLGRASRPSPDCDSSTLLAPRPKTSLLHPYPSPLKVINPTTRWTMTRSSKVNLPHAINCRALCGANFVRLRSQFRASETLVLQRAEEREKPCTYAG